MMTDPIADMLTRLRNANSAYHETVDMPHSKLKSHIAEILKQEGYIAGYAVADPGDGKPGKVLTLTLKYGPNRERSIAGVRRVSKPGAARVRQVVRAAPGAGRTRHGDHLDVVRAAHRQAGRQTRRGRGSPRLRLVRRGQP
jgi:ribosomal protein S8